MGGWGWVGLGQKELMGFGNSPAVSLWLSPWQGLTGLYCTVAASTSIPGALTCSSQPVHHSATAFPRLLLFPTRNPGFCFFKDLILIW